MQEAVSARKFERAALLRDVLLSLKRAIDEAKKALPRPFKSRNFSNALKELQTLLKLRSLPERIEAFDVSNIFGNYATASMVVAIDGKPFSKDYRMFKIKTVLQADDPAMIAEAVLRRYSRLIAEKRPLPQLVLVDGGATQLIAARDALDKLGLVDLSVAGLAKKYEEIYVFDENNKVSVIQLDSNNPALHILQRLRDEAHRFALNFHKKLRSKKLKESLLDEIDGIGESKKKILLDAFGSVDSIRLAKLEDIASIKGIGYNLAKKLKEHLA